jgi:hypothetical protein
MVLRQCNSRRALAQLSQRDSACLRLFTANLCHTSILQLKLFNCFIDDLGDLASELCQFRVLVCAVPAQLDLIC